MPLGFFVAGPYTGAYTRATGGNPFPIGLTETGYTIEHTVMKEMVAKTDAYGDSPIDGIYTGMSVTISIMMIEWLRSAFEMIFYSNLLPTTAVPPYPVTASGAQNLNIGLPGLLDTNMMGSLTLTAIAGTPAAAAPATHTFFRCGVSENSGVQFVYAPTLRKLPIRLRAYPEFVGTQGTTHQRVQFWATA